MSASPLSHAAVRAHIREEAALTQAFVVMNTLATIIACYGLLTDATAVVIGGMVIAMLLGPITGIALGLVEGDDDLLRRALATEDVGAVLVLAISFGIGRLHAEFPAGRGRVAGPVGTPPRAGMAKKRANDQGMIGRHKTGCWVARLVVDGKRRCDYGATRREVEEKLTRAKRDRDRGLSVADEALTVGQYLRHWLDNDARQTVKPNT